MANREKGHDSVAELRAQLAASLEADKQGSAAARDRRIAEIEQGGKETMAAIDANKKRIVSEGEAAMRQARIELLQDLVAGCDGHKIEMAKVFGRSPVVQDVRKEMLARIDAERAGYIEQLRKLGVSVDQPEQGGSPESAEATDAE